MAEHVVKVKIPQRVEVLSKDLEVQVIRNGRRLGTLKISRGSGWTGGTHPTSSRTSCTGKTSRSWRSNTGTESDENSPRFRRVPHFSRSLREVGCNAIRTTTAASSPD